jgi:hypothetical protein
MPARLIVHAHYTLDEEIELTFKHIAEENIDDIIEEYLEQIKDGVYIEEGVYNPDLDKNARMFFGLSNKRSSDGVAENKKVLLRPGLPTDMAISKVYSISHVTRCEDEESDEEEEDDTEEDEESDEE